LRLNLADRPEPHPEDPVFLSERGGKPLALRTVQATIAELGQRAHIRRLPVTPHLMRHTFALRYLKHNPGELLELATLLGHESLDTTALYARPTVEQLAAGVERSQHCCPLPLRRARCAGVV
jgi:site-specific recombinase XerD